MSATTPIRFNDGVAYEFGMGRWSALVGTEFLDWLAPAPGLAWVDVGCGNGAFTELIAQRCAPAVLEGIDPSDGQISFATGRRAAAKAHFQIGDAMALPFPDDQFDIAIMALVIFFVPDPAKGIAEMRRVVRPGGRVAAYAWDFPGGGFPFQPLRLAMEALGMETPAPPHATISAAAALLHAWQGAGLDAIEQRPFTVHRIFRNADEFWDAAKALSTSRTAIESMPPDVRQRLRERTDALLPAPEPDGTLRLSATANAIVGRRPDR